MTQAQNKRMGERLHELRLARGLTLEALAGKCGLTRGYLSLVERDRKTPSVAALLRLAEALQTEIGALFDGRPAATADHVLHRHRGGGYGPDAVPLAPGRAGKIMEPFIVAPPSKALERFTHAGEELIVVLCGQVMVRLGDEDILLGVNDSLYFSASTQHSLRSVGPVQAELLVVIGRQARDPASRE
jgi:transcriptional regulator with XRE-family HTH domain